MQCIRSQRRSQNDDVTNNQKHAKPPVAPARTSADPPGNWFSLL